MNNQQFLIHQQNIERQIHSVWMPHDGQVDIATAFFVDWITGVFLRCGRKFGKALSLDTPILTPSGFVPIGDIKSGDFVFDEKGKIQSVFIAHDIIDNPDSYRIHFCNGTHIDACADHQWFTWTKSDRKNFRRGYSYNPSVKSTLDIFNTQMSGKEFNHSIPYANIIKMPDVELPIDPYILGLWLGDGTTGDARFSTTDIEILEYIRLRYVVTKLKGDNVDYYIRGINTKLRDIGVLENKHIPVEYMYSSEQQRLELLRGLMDSDGTINKNGNHCCFDNTNENLARGVDFLVSSLGMKPMFSHRIPKLNGVEHKKCYRVAFAPLVEVFKLTRKRERIRYNNTKFKHHTIKLVEKIESRPMRCLTVSGESKLFLSGRNLIPTHNTELAIYCMYMFAKLFPNSECYYVADEKDHARDICWDNRRLPEFFTSFTINEGESAESFANRRTIGRRIQDSWVKKVTESDMMVRLDNGSMLKVDGAKNWKKADGLGPIFLVYDEFKNHDPRYDRAARPNLKTFNGRIMIIGTPPDNEDNYYCETEIEFQNRPNHRYFSKPSWMNNHVYGGPNCPKLKEEREAYTRKGELHVYLREYECLIVPDTKRQIFPMFTFPKKNFETGLYEGRTNHVRPHFEVLSIISRRPKDWDWYCSFDAGSALAFGVLMVGINRYTKQVVLCDEVYETEHMRTTTRVVYPQAQAKMSEIHAFMADWYQIYDNAALWFANEVAAEYDEALMPCTKDMNKKEAKLSLIKDIMLEYNERIGDYMFIVSDRCQKFIWEAVGYATDNNGKIPKVNDHLLDNLRYILNQAHYDTLWVEYKQEKSKRRYETPETDFNRGKQYDY